MLPMFKSHYSIGKSILTLDDPSESLGSSDSILEICSENKIKDLVLVEDCPTGFFKAYKQSEKFNLNLIFGLRLKLSSFSDQENDDSIHKCILFAKNSNGIKILNKIYSHFFCNLNGVGNYKFIKDLWKEEDLIFSVPFYDSFLYYNTFYFANCLPDFSFCNPIFFIEDNGLPYDSFLKEEIEKYCLDNSFNFHSTKSIYYKLRSDIEAFQTYKCICNRSFGRKKTMSNPGLEGLGSSEFCFESYLEKSKNNNEETLSL